MSSKTKILPWVFVVEECVISGFAIYRSGIEDPGGCGRAKNIKDDVPGGREIGAASAILILAPWYIDPHN